MSRAALTTLALLGVAGCPPPAKSPDGAPAATRAALYRHGDQRVAGATLSEEPVPWRPPSALIALRKSLSLRAGDTVFELPDLPAEAAPGSIWLRPIRGPGPLVVERVWRPAPLSDPRAFRGATVRAGADSAPDDQHGGVVEGRLVHVDERGAIIERGNKLVVVGPRLLELPAITGGPRPARVDVTAERPGRYELEIAYRTDVISWTLDHAVEIAAGQSSATIRSVIAVDNRGAALGPTDLELFEGRYDSEERPARPIWRGRVDLDSGEARHPLPPRTVEAEVGYRYRGFAGGRDERRGQRSYTATSTELVERVVWLPPGALPPAAAVARVDINATGEPPEHYRVFVRAPDSDVADAPVELSLGPVSDLGGSRRQLSFRAARDGSEITEAFEIAVVNRGESSAVVRVIEPLARSGDVELTERPEASRVVAGALQIDLVVGPQRRESFRYAARYRMRR